MELELAKSIRSEQMTMTSGNSVKPTRADPRQDVIQKPGPGHSVNVGLALRGLRAGHGLSIRALASKSGLAVNTLSLIEHNKTSPSVLTLQQLASALGVPITAFFQNDAPKTRVAYVKGSQRIGAAFAHGTLEDLGSNLTERTIEPFVVTIRVQCEQWSDSDRSHGARVYLLPGGPYPLQRRGRDLPAGTGGQPPV